MIAVIATIKTKEGMGPQFEAAFAPLAAAVRTNEAGNSLYQLTRASEPDTYKVLEIYADQQAIEDHRAAAHFKELGAALGPFMAGRPDIERLEAL